MQREKFCTIIVMYTFHEKNKDERDAFREALEKKFNIEQLDESTYSLKGEVDVKKVNEELTAMCKDTHFDENEFVAMYYACALIDYTDQPYRDKIKRVQIGGK